MVQKKSTALARPAQKFLSVQERVNRSDVQAALLSALPLVPGDREQQRNRLLRIWLTAVRQNKNLSLSTTESLLASLLEAAQLGLETDGVLGHAYLVPYYNKKSGVYEATLQIGYRGFITLAHRSGRVSYVAAELVRQKDEFEIDLGTNRHIHHRPSLEDGGEIIGAYAVVRFTDGSTDFEFMTRKQIDAIKNRSQAKGEDSPWQTHYEEMARKSPIRKMAKRLPLSPDIIRSVVADEYREEGERKLAPPPIDVAGYLEEPPPTGRVIREDEPESVEGEVVPQEGDVIHTEQGSFRLGADANHRPITVKLTGKKHTDLAYINGSLTHEMLEFLKKHEATSVFSKGWEIKGIDAAAFMDWLTEQGIEYEEES